MAVSAVFPTPFTPPFPTKKPRPRTPKRGRNFKLKSAINKTRSKAIPNRRYPDDDPSKIQ